MKSKVGLTLQLSFQIKEEETCSDHEGGWLRARILIPVPPPPSSTLASMGLWYKGVLATCWWGGNPDSWEGLTGGDKEREGEKRSDWERVKKGGDETQRFFSFE